MGEVHVDCNIHAKDCTAMVRDLYHLTCCMVLCDSLQIQVESGAPRFVGIPFGHLEPNDSPQHLSKPSKNCFCRDGSRNEFCRVYGRKGRPRWRSSTGSNIRVV